MLKWAPDPHAPVYGLGMNVANRPACLATCFAISRKNVSWSAISQRGRVLEVELVLAVAALGVEAEHAEAGLLHVP